MAMELVGGIINVEAREGTVTAGVAIAAGDVLAINGNVIQRATGSSTILTIVGVAAETISTTATKIKYIPITQGQRWKCLTNAPTATTQLYEGMILTDCAIIANSDTTVPGPTAVFWCDGIADSTHLLGEFIRVKSTTA